jgi:hypothetical protein
MTRYAVRSRQIIDLLGEVRRKVLILSPHFQRNLVWREGHKADFIETILMGYPFPQIFIAKGTLDFQEMISTSSVVDGQQRMNTIVQYVNDQLVVRGGRFSELSVSEREKFLKYEVAVIDLDIRDNDPKVTEIFKRLNRTFYALSTIEKFSTEFASTEYMLVAKYLCGEILSKDVEDELTEPSTEADPNLTPDFRRWASGIVCESYRELMLEGRIFSPFETSRMVHLMYTLNLMATYEFGFYNRNDRAKECLENTEVIFSNKDNIARVFEATARFYLKL